MSDAHIYDDLVRRLAAAVRGATLYSPEHPIVPIVAEVLRKHKSRLQVTRSHLGYYSLAVMDQLLQGLAFSK